jgi:hypothetical protein
MAYKLLTARPTMLGELCNYHDCTHSTEKIKKFQAVVEMTAVTMLNEARSLRQSFHVCGTANEDERSPAMTSRDRDIRSSEPTSGLNCSGPT